MLLLVLLCIASNGALGFSPTSRIRFRSTATNSAIRIIADKDTPYDISSIGMPSVIAPRELTEKWMLWFHGRGKSLPENLVKGSSGRVYHATSEDGLTWSIHPDSPVLSPSKEQGDWFYFDSEHVGVGDVLIPGKSAQSLVAVSDGVFFMYTFGGNSDTVVVDGKEILGAKMEIGVAISQDGVHWSRIEGDSPYGSVIEKGLDADFDLLFCGWPTIVEDGALFRMFYHSYNAKTKKFVVGAATSSNGVRWTKKGAVFDGGGKGSFDEMGVTRRHVLRMRDGSLRMWYEGISALGVHSIGLATSRNGMQWERFSDEPIFQRSDGDAFDGGGVGSPRLVYLSDRNRWRMYYVGIPAGSTQNYDGNSDAVIGVAESSDAEGVYFERMHIEV